jgi:hypothetical protein
MPATAVVLALLAGVTRGPSPPPAPAPPPALEPDAVVQTLYLVGDAGHPAKGGEPVLLALRRHLEREASRATVVFLGDNLYPSGLPAPGHPDLAEMERRLDDQVDAVRDTGARVVFIPGNHDWHAGGRDGVRRQERRVEARGGASVSYLPDEGCPGPATLDVGERLRLVALDTQWWLEPGERRGGGGPPCPAGSEDAVVAAVRSAVAGAGARAVVVAAHHPPVSGGPHGGKFGLKQHLFPLTELKKGFFLPLPIVGSLYPGARAAGISAQDQGSGEYRRMRGALLAAVSGRPPLAWASGHEHVLQVIESRQWGRVLVSGSGVFGHVTWVHEVEGSLYGAARSGFMRLDFPRSGKPRLGVVEVEKDGGYREAFARTLE